MIDQRVERLEQQVRYLQRRLLRESEYTAPDGPAPDPVGFPVLGSPENPVPTPETPDTRAEVLLASLKATLARSEQDRYFGPHEFRQECLRLIREALAGAVSHPQPEVPVQRCHICGQVATCLGEYETCTGVDRPACDRCCGHGNEDGHCRPIGAHPVVSPRPQPEMKTIDPDTLLALATRLEATFDPGGTLPEDCEEWATEHANVIGELRGLAECALMGDDEG